MLEKNSNIVLTPQDIEQYNRGVVSDRVKQMWGIENIDDLRMLVESQKSIICQEDITDGSQ